MENKDIICEYELLMRDISLVLKDKLDVDLAYKFVKGLSIISLDNGKIEANAIGRNMPRELIISFLIHLLNSIKNGDISFRNIGTEIE